MAIFCLSTSLEDLQNRLGNIIIGYTRDRKEIRARELNADGAMTTLLKDAFLPNLVQTLEKILQSFMAVLLQILLMDAIHS